MDRVLPRFKYIFFHFPIEQLETMITDENAMFDVLGDFFYHVNTKVRVAALEVSHFTDFFLIQLFVYI